MTYNAHVILPFTIQVINSKSTSEEETEAH